MAGFYCTLRPSAGTRGVEVIGCISDNRLFRKIGQLVTAFLIRKDKKGRTKA